MSDKYYGSLCDDAQQFIRMAQDRLRRAKEMLDATGNPSRILAAGRIISINGELLGEASKAIDLLPADLGNVGVASAKANRSN